MLPLLFENKLLCITKKKSKNDGNNLIERKLSQKLPLFQKLKLTYHIWSSFSLQSAFITAKHTQNPLKFKYFFLIALFWLFFFALFSPSQFDCYSQTAHGVARNKGRFIAKNKLFGSFSLAECQKNEMAFLESALKL